MVLVRRIQGRNTRGWVEANGELLFTATGDVGRWKRRFSARVTAETRKAAPGTRKKGRPRWGYEGPRLRSTFTSSTSYQPGRMKVYSVVGSRSDHAVFVDQGTGIHGGGGPYPAAILPPWTNPGPSLYEGTWIPGGTGRPLRLTDSVMIKGQEGQGFFEEGLRRGFARMRMRSFQVPGEGGLGREALVGLPGSLVNQVLNGSQRSPAFRAQLEDWRRWRDEAFYSGESFEKGGVKGKRSVKGDKREKSRKRAEEKAKNLDGGAAKSTQKKKERGRAPTTVPPAVGRAVRADITARGLEVVGKIVFYNDHTWTAFVRPKGSRGRGIKTTSSW